MNKISLADAIPIRQFEWEIDDDTNLITILRPKFLTPFLQKYLLPLFTGKIFKIHLDELGSAVWKHCDGEKTFNEILNALKKTYPDLPDLDDRLKKFIMQLYRQKFIQLVEKVRTG